MQSHYTFLIYFQLGWKPWKLSKRQNDWFRSRLASRGISDNHNNVDETFSYFHCKKQIKNGELRVFNSAVFWILSSVLRRTAARQFRIIFLICLHFHGIWSTLPMNISIKNTEQYLYGVSELLFCYLKVILIERGRKTEKTGLVWQIDTWDISWK